MKKLPRAGERASGAVRDLSAFEAHKPPTLKQKRQPAAECGSAHAADNHNMVACVMAGLKGALEAGQTAGKQWHIVLACGPVKPIKSGFILDEPVTDCLLMCIQNMNGKVSFAIEVLETV